MQDERPRFTPSLDGLPEAVIAAALTGQILYWNRLALLASLDRAAIPADGNRSILVVDDDEANLKLAEKTLGQLGYRPVCRSSAASALEAAAAEPPAAVVLDLLMSEMDGFEFLRRFRTDANAWRTPVIYAMKGDEERARAAGCDGYIAKPIDTRRLPELVAELLEAPR